MSVLILLAGIALIAVVADRFVDAAARLSVRLGVSALVVGVVVIGLGTSLPELYVSAVTSSQGRGLLAIGNVAGSNTVNVTLVLGAAALMRPLRVEGSVVRREAPLAVAATAAFALAVWASSTHRAASAVMLLAIGAGMLASLLRNSRTAEASADAFSVEVRDEVARAEDEARHGHAGSAGTGPERGEHLGRLAARTVVLLAALLASSQLLLSGAEGVADLVGLSDQATGVLLLAVGTSLPELASAIAAARRDEADLLVGNLWGSNLFNATLVGGVTLAAGSVGDVDTTLLVIPLLAGLLAWATMMRVPVMGRVRGSLLVASGTAFVLMLSA